MTSWFERFFFELNQTQSNNNSTKRDLGNWFLKYDVIHDALKVILNKNFKHLRNFGDIGSVGDMGTGRNLAKNPEIA